VYEFADQFGGLVIGCFAALALGMLDTGDSSGF
jgi:hypothetical protein